MAFITFLRNFKFTLSYALKKSRETNAAEELILLMFSIVLIKLLADVQILEPGMEQLCGDLQTEPITDKILLVYFCQEFIVLVQ